MKKKLLNLTAGQIEAIKYIAQFSLSENVKIIHGNILNALLKKRIIQKGKNRIDYTLTNRGRAISVGL